VRIFQDCATLNPITERNVEIVRVEALQKPVGVAKPVWYLKIRSKPTN
jgi:hypothetical protein